MQGGVCKKPSGPGMWKIEVDWCRDDCRWGVDYGKRNRPSRKKTLKNAFRSDGPTQSGVFDSGGLPFGESGMEESKGDKERGDVSIRPRYQRVLGKRRGLKGGQIAKKKMKGSRNGKERRVSKRSPVELERETHNKKKQGRKEK